ncbi:M23 family metallopeptidase [Spirochaetia bacterium 38H-sp]|uniref:M23 family metallopeptidase n=1 Tax=Rarispira pelagica TaxID=3141764 RepID=A0ABU9U9B9_9SPIR
MKKLVLLFIFFATALGIFSQDFAELSFVQEDGYVTIKANNNLDIPVSVVITYLKGADTNQELPLILPPIPSSAKNQAIGRIKQQEGKKLSIKWISMPGSITDNHPDEDFLYIFPFQHGTKHRVDQGFNGSFTHKNDNRYAIDFAMDIGTPVCAARSGIVAYVKEDSSTGGPSASYANDANYILIYHADGTFGNYVHLKKDGAIVKPGDRVEAGQVIGYSGNTGQSSGPHLHFDVRIPTTHGLQSIPIQFLNYDAKPVIPQEGEYYYALHPGKEPFKVILGSLLKNEHFTDYQAVIEKKDKIIFRTEDVDSTTVVFIGNGFDYPVEITVELLLTNMEASTQKKITLTLPPLTERFLTILRPTEGAASWRYGYRYTYKRTE